MAENNQSNNVAKLEKNCNTSSTIVSLRLILGLTWKNTKWKLLRSLSAKILQCILYPKLSLASKSNPA